MNTRIIYVIFMHVFRENITENNFIIIKSKTQEYFLESNINKKNIVNYFLLYFI